MKEKEIDQQKQRKTKLAVGNITPLNTPYNWVSAPYLGSHFLKHQIFFDNFPRIFQPLPALSFFKFSTAVASESGEYSIPWVKLLFLL